MDDDVRERLDRIEARLDELAGLVAGRPAAAGAGTDGPAAGPPPDQCVAERCTHPGEPLTDATGMTVYPKGPDGEPDRSSPWPIHRACFSPSRHVPALSPTDVSSHS